MNYFKYDLTTGKLFQYMEYPYPLPQESFTVLGIIEAGSLTEKDLYRYKVNLQTLTLEELPPTIVYVKHNQLKAYYTELENSPVNVSGLLVDCDSTSQFRMQDAITTFDLQPLYSGEFEVVDGIKVIFWTFADNVRRPLTKQQLMELYEGMINCRSIRRSQLFKAYSALKVRSDVTYEEMYDSATWE